MVTQLGLSNVDLQAADIMDLPDAFGSFDYIIAHGLYSWVLMKCAGRRCD